MNKLIKEQLDKCEVAIIPEYNDETNQLIIPKVIEENLNVELAINNWYIIKLNDYIINPPNCLLLANNWNKGIIPKSKYLLVKLNNFLGKMIQIDGCGYDYKQNKKLDDSYSNLWLPKSGFIILKNLNDC